MVFNKKAVDNIYKKIPVLESPFQLKKRLQHRGFPVAKFLRTPMLKDPLLKIMATSELILDSENQVKTFQNHPDSVILQKYQSLLQQSFKHNSGHMPSLHLTPTFHFVPFIINGYYTKSKRL